MITTGAVYFRSFNHGILVAFSIMADMVGRIGPVGFLKDGTVWNNGDFGATLSLRTEMIATFAY